VPGLLVILSIMPAVVSTSVVAGRMYAAEMPDPGEQNAMTYAQQADLVALGARIWTGTGTHAGGAGADGRDGEPSAVAARGGRIVAVGADSTVRVLIGPRTRVIEASGRRVIPGMTDSHTHLIGGGLQLEQLMLRGLSCHADFLAAVAAAARDRRPGEWVLGRGWTVDSWADPQPPDAAMLDAVTGAVPVYLVRMDGHQALVNSAALRLAGIDASGPPDPPGGEIERDPKTGAPLGILKESAMDLVSARIPPPTWEQRCAALRRAVAHAHALGITSVHDMSEPDDLAVFRWALAEGDLTLRVFVYLHVEQDWPRWAGQLAETAREEHLAMCGFKAFMDGSLGSRTAYMREPYRDAAPHERYPRGQLTALAGDADRFRQMLHIGDAHGLRLAVHAIGDEANHILLDAYEALPRRGQRPSVTLNRIEHAQHLLVEDIPRFARLNVAASMQPLHKADDGRYAERALSTEQLRGSYAYRQLLDAGALLCFGSDWPVVEMNPFAGVDSAVNARTLAGNVWLPEHSIKVEEALRAYTVSPARAVGASDRLGTIEVGKLADLVILSDDPFTIPAEQVGELTVAVTIVDGKIVYERAAVGK